MTSLLVSSLAAGFLLLSSLTAPEVEAPRDGVVAIVHEPSDVLDLGVRVISSTDLGSTVRVRVHLSIHPKQNVTTARVWGAILHGPGFDEAFGIPDELVSLTKNRPRNKDFVLEIPKGREHRFVFSVCAEDGGMTCSPGSTAYLRVNLDPALEPERGDGLLQYRANMVGE